MSRTKPVFALGLALLIRRFAAALAALILSSPMYAQTTPKAASPTARRSSSQIEIYETAGDLHEVLVEKPRLSFSKGQPDAIVVHVDESHSFQQIDGFGASFTDAAAWLFAEKLTPEQRSYWLRQLFDRKKGIGLSVLRQPMGSSDFSTEDSSYDDMPSSQTDPDLHHFSIDRDRKYILRVLRKALAVNRNIKIIASPWSPPGWMKSSGSMTLGSLLPSSYGPLARYFVRFVQSYEAAGVPIFAVTPQNEPRNLPKDYPGMAMTDVEQTIFVRDHLGPAFREAGLKSKILIFDHNWDMIDYPETILSDGAAAQFIAGTATHCYGGAPSAQSVLHDRYPYKDIWLTECSGGEWQKGNALVEAASLIVQASRNWAKSVVLWNLALDQNHGPHLGGCTNCRAVVTIDHSTQPATVTQNADFAALAHASKFVVPGAFRVESSFTSQSAIEHVAFRNPDGSIVLLVLNPADSPATFAIDWRAQQASYTLKPGSVVTFRWLSGPHSSRVRK